MKYSHLSQILPVNAKKFGEDPIFKAQDRVTGTWFTISWNTFLKRSEELAQALCNYGIKPTDKIGTYLQNQPACFYTDFAAFFNRATVVLVYPTSSVSQLSYIAQDTGFEILFVGEQFQYDNAFEASKECKSIKQIVVLDSSVTFHKEDKRTVYYDDFISSHTKDPQDRLEVEKRMKSADPEDLAYLMYTSGTSGELKGVMATHNNYIEILKYQDIPIPKEDGERFTTVNFLPLSHIFEKGWSLFIIYRGGLLGINYDPLKVMDAIREIKPQSMCTIPRFLEKMHAGLQETIENSKPSRKALLLKAIAVGKEHNVDYINNGKRPPLPLRLKYKFYSNLVFKSIRKAVGFDNILGVTSSSAYMSPNIISFFHSIGIPVSVCYGLTEAALISGCYYKKPYIFGSVGEVYPGIEIRIGENNEIQVKSSMATQGYYNNPEATKALFTEDGWLRTGDAGKYDPETRTLFLVERLKSLYKTSNGKFIAPQQLEGRLAEDRYIETATIIAEKRKFVSALIVPNFPELEVYAKKHNIPFDDHKSLIAQPAIVEKYRSQIDSIQKELADYEKIKRFTLLSEPFTTESGELTNTMKLKRNFIAEKYKEEIDKMYR